MTNTGITARLSRYDRDELILGSLLAVVLTALVGILTFAVVQWATAIDSGFVTAKSYEPGHSILITRTDCFSGTCRVALESEWVPECYQLDLINAGEIGAVCVERDVFDRVAKGDRFGA